RAFAALFDQDIQTFTGSMLLNLDQLEKHLHKEEFQETGSIDAFRALMTQCQTFINFRYYFDDFEENNETESETHVSSSRSGNDTYAEDGDINSVNDKQLMDEVNRNTTPDSTDMSHRGGEIDQNAEKCQNKTVENADLKAQIQEKVFANAAFKNELRKLKGNRVDTKFAKPSILGKLVLQPLRNHSIIKQPNAFKSKRPNFPKLWIASQVDMNDVLSKPVTPYYLPKVREYVLAKPHHMIAPCSSKNNPKETYRSNDMAHKYYLEEAKKKAQERDRKSTTSVMPFAKS
ncbi:hypothetical protein Tco_1281514, partial [Tanacetum coccineum]